MSTIESSLAVIDFVLDDPDYDEIDKCAIRSIRDAYLSLANRHEETLDKLIELRKENENLQEELKEALDKLLETQRQYIALMLKNSENNQG